MLRTVLHRSGVRRRKFAVSTTSPIITVHYEGCTGGSSKDGHDCSFDTISSSRSDFEIMAKKETLDDLFESFKKLGVSSSGDVKSLRPNKKLQETIDGIGFSIFQTKADLGFFGWHPRGSYKSLLSVTAAELKQNIRLDMVPDTAVSVQVLQRKMPMTFANLSPQTVINKYPHGQYYIASLYVALKHRQLPLEKIDFLFGGSTLHMLASQTIPMGSAYLVTCVPGTDILVMVKHKEYTQNFSDFGFQFERLVTGKKFHDQHDVDLVEHLQWMDVGGYGVLFAAEADAVDSNGDPVEIKASNPRNWGPQTVLQMMSSGSLNLYAGSKFRDKLERVKIMSLDAVAKDVLYDGSCRGMEMNIENGMKVLKDEVKAGRFQDGKVFSISFSSSMLKLVPHVASSNALLPPDKVVEELLH